MSATPYFASFNICNAEFGIGVVVFPNAILGKPPCAPAGRLAKPSEVTGRPVRIGADSVIGCNVVIYEGVVIGEGCLIGDGAIIRENCIIGDHTTIGMNTVVGPRVVIGCHTRVMELSQVGGDTTIGDHVFIAPGFRSAADDSMGRDDIIVWSGPLIEDHVRIGIGVCVLPGVVVGQDAVVGAGSIVTRHVESGTVVMGKPARYWRSLADHEKVCSSSPIVTPSSAPAHPELAVS